MKYEGNKISYINPLHLKSTSAYSAKQHTNKFREYAESVKEVTIVLSMEESEKAETKSMYTHFYKDFQLNMALVVNCFPKYRLSWCLSGAYLKAYRKLHRIYCFVSEGFRGKTMRRCAWCKWGLLKFWQI